MWSYEQKKYKTMVFYTRRYGRIGSILEVQFSELDKKTYGSILIHHSYLKKYGSILEKCSEYGHFFDHWYIWCMVRVCLGMNHTYIPTQWYLFMKARLTGHRNNIIAEENSGTLYEALGYVCQTRECV
jgi:hypothetical protein